MLRVCPFSKGLLKEKIQFMESDGCPDRECAFWVLKGYCCAVMLAYETAEYNRRKLDQIAKHLGLE